MPRLCTVCVHESRAEMERELLAGHSLRDIARHWRVSKDALARHKSNHLPAHLALARKALVVAQADDLLAQVEALRDQALGLLDRAQNAGDLRAAISAIREARSCVELLAKMVGELKDGQTVNVLVTPEWTTARSLIVTALAPFPEARVAVSSALKGLTGDR